MRTKLSWFLAGLVLLPAVLFVAGWFGLLWGGQFRDSTGRDVSAERIWLAVTFLRHLDSLPPSVAAEWNKQR